MVHCITTKGNFRGLTQKEVKALITDNGGTVKSTITSKVECLIVDGNSPDLQSTKCCAARKSNIPIVTIEYLHDSIKKGSAQKMERYQMKDDEEEEMDVDEEEEEEEEKEDVKKKSYKKIKMVGAAPVDEFFRDGDTDGWRVHEENGTVYDCTLNYVDIRNNNNKACLRLRFLS